MYHHSGKIGGKPERWYGTRVQASHVNPKCQARILWSWRLTQWSLVVGFVRSVWNHIFWPNGQAQVVEQSHSSQSGIRCTGCRKKAAKAGWSAGSCCNSNILKPWSPFTKLRLPVDSALLAFLRVTREVPPRIQRPGVDDTLWYGHLLTTGIWHWQINRQPYDRGWVNHFSQGLSQLSGSSVHRFSCFCITCGSSFHGLYPAPRIWERPWENFLQDMRHVFFW